jgi:ribonuclease R
LAREQAKYEYPLPSREYILQILAAEGAPLSTERLVGLLDIHGDELEPFRRRLGAMARDGQLLQNRRDDWLIPDKADLIRGRILGHPDGFGFLVPEDGGSDIFLSAKEMDKVLHGDRAIVRVVGLDRRGRPEGKIVEVTERINKTLVGRLVEERGVMLVVPENRRISQDILLAPLEKTTKKAPKLQAGQVVMVELIEQPSRNAQPIGRVIEVLGNYADPGMEIEIALRKHELPFEFSKGALGEAKKLADNVSKSDWAGREDITHLPLVTIDGETAKDFDDAVFCERQGRGFRLVVAIADVSHYVKADGALDRDAYERGNSVYFPRRVIPMLPEKLSNGLCSLNPQVERLCMVCDMLINATGKITRYRFYPAVMFSHARLTYTEVAAALYDRDTAAMEKLAPVLPHLVALDALFRKLEKTRAKRGAIDFETVETRMLFDDHGKIERIEPYERNDAHRLIEECMLAANVCASEFLQAQAHPTLYRVHEGPTPERLERLRDFLGTFGLQLAGGETPTAKNYAELIDKIADRPDKQLLQTVMLRSLRQAVYSPDNVGHFGLAYDSYTHFTSPIRRYPDLLVHRAIKSALAGRRYEPGSWDEIGQHCSKTERRADEATRDVEMWLKCYYMRDRVGEVFVGSISSVVPFGIFVALDGVFVEGLVHVSDLGQDYFHFDEKTHSMVGERSGVRYRLSDRVQVQLMRVDMEASKIDFRLASPAAGAGGSARYGGGAVAESTPKTTSQKTGVAGKASAQALSPRAAAGKEPPRPDRPKSAAKRTVSKTKAKPQGALKGKPKARSKARTKPKTKARTK